MNWLQRSRDLETLQARAQHIYPNNPSMQQKWVDAVVRVRETKNGWILDNFVQRKGDVK